ncbi:glutamyl-tRNA amidotransferase [Alteromonas alba]|uniref:Glutamyl-tRNA amidotransferase n=1 Tax=Alteromonas alba TaxID=2079529 RepID=A0A2S9VGU0_9ALTE|nr:GatB/YqeY domain-containing protein [Alteromonas alba]PRO75535.1 glutamyl-tRNA amidotransferase [Alteromonas alba]|tara:strand:+ start:601 stop:1044 length:444 start_codon:yes stop_codon:yes gene_type:complete
MALIDDLKNAQKEAMRAKNKVRLGTIRMALAAIKQKEIDEQVTLGDSDILAVLTKMVKQRQDAAAQYDSAGREDLAQTERSEIVELESFLPQPLTKEEIAVLIDEAMTSTGASGMQDMGKVMGVLKPQVQGRADMGALSAQIKQRLG